MSVASPEIVSDGKTAICACCRGKCFPTAPWGLCVECRGPGHADVCTSEQARNRKPERCPCQPPPASFRDCFDGAERASDPMIPSSAHAMRWRPPEWVPDYQHAPDCAASS